MSEYRPRLADKELSDALKAFGAVLITGPKWSGKTTTASRIAASVLKLQDPDTKERNLALARLRPSTLLKGDNPRLIDEWQEAPQLWDAVRMDVDERGERGLYILTGSVNVDEGAISHSGTGRIYRMRMNTMSLFESGDSNGSILLRSLFEGTSEVEGSSDVSLHGVASLLVRGGWPESIGMDEDIAMMIVRGYCESILNTDVSEADGKSRDARRVRGLMRAMSRGISQPVSKASIAEDMRAVEGSPISANTLDDYMSALRAICVLDEMQAWNPNLRSKTAIRTSDTLHLCDPAIAAYFLSASPDDLMNDPRTFGLLFESLVVRDLRIYSRSIGGDVFHYRDKTGLEADAVIHLNDGRWALVEVKLGESWVDEGAANLIKLRDRINTDTMGEPSFMAVIIATGVAYTREDGVHVIPITCLRD